MILPPPTSTLFPYTTLFRSATEFRKFGQDSAASQRRNQVGGVTNRGIGRYAGKAIGSSTFQTDRKSTRLNSSHRTISYAVFCLKKKKTNAMRSLYRVQSSGH